MRRTARVVFTEEFHSINEEASDAHYRADYQAALNGPSVTLISNLSLALVGMIGVSLFLKGSFTIGVLTSFILYSRRFSGPINEIAAIIAELQSGLSAAERVFTLLEQPPEPPDAEHALPLEDVRGIVEFDRVSFAYTPDQPVIRDFSVKTNPGELFAIVGSTGAGKTTLINLLMRFYDPQEGEILIDGKRLLDITRDALRLFAMVLQDTWLFQGTIRDNIAYGNGCDIGGLSKPRKPLTSPHILNHSRMDTTASSATAPQPFSRSKAVDDDCPSDVARYTDAYPR